MTTLRPFFLLIARASVFWLGAFAVVVGLLIVGGVAGAETELGAYLDATFIATLWFPAAAGWLVGLVIQEFQHTSFAHQLPGVRFRLSVGYLSTGFVVAVVVANIVSDVVARTSPASESLPLMIVLGLGAYCVGGVLQDPLSNRITVVNAFLVLLVVVRSRDLATLTSEHPWMAGVVSLGIGAAGVRRLFAGSTFRRKPFRLTKPLPGRFSLERSDAYERQRRLEDRSKIMAWRPGYIGRNSWSWVRAAFYETHGALGWKTISRTLNSLWALPALVLIYAWADKGDMAFGEAIGRALYDALFRSPHVAPFGEQGGPYAMVVIVIAAAGIVTALFRAVALVDVIPHPLSRLQRARVAFRGGLVDAGFLMCGLGAGLYAAGHVTGLLVGYEVRFDFMPFYFRALMVTLVLMPLGYWGRLQLHAAVRRRTGNMLVAVAFGVVAFVVVVFLGVMISSQIFPSPILELTALVTALLVSQLVYRQVLAGYYRTADLS